MTTEQHPNPKIEFVNTMDTFPLSSLLPELRDCLSRELINDRDRKQLWVDLVAYLSQEQWSYAMAYQRYQIDTMNRVSSPCPTSELGVDVEEAIQYMVRTFYQKFGFSV